MGEQAHAFTKEGVHRLEGIAARSTHKGEAVKVGEMTGKEKVLDPNLCLDRTSPSLRGSAEVMWLPVSTALLGNRVLVDVAKIS